MELICPVCGQALSRKEKQYSCENQHCFDIARQGYTNLLPVQHKHSLNPGDTREQVLARRSFLEANFYQPIVDALIQEARVLSAKGPLLDVGCGEGYYSTRLADAIGAELTGLDISKEAVRCAAAKYKGPTWLCATASRIPVTDGSAGLITSLFALTLPEEFCRCLRQGGYFFRVTAREDHLMELKSIIYPEIKHKQKETAPQLPGFDHIKTVPITFSFTAENEQVQNLLSMTPHFYRISKEGLERIRAINTLSTTANCQLEIYMKIKFHRI